MTSPLTSSDSGSIHSTHEHTTQHKNRTNEKNKVQKYKLNISHHACIRYTTILSIIAYFLTNIFSIRRMFCILFGESGTDTAATILWFAARTMMNSVFVFRLKHAFKNTVYQSQPCIFVILYCLLSFLPLCVMYMLAIQILLMFHVNISMKFRYCTSF